MPDATWRSHIPWRSHRTWRGLGEPAAPLPFDYDYEASVEYRVVIRDMNGTPLDEVPAKNLQFSWSLNEVGTCGFTLPKNHEKCTVETLEPGGREILIYRNGVRVWGGYLWFAGLTTTDTNVRFQGEGWLSRLDRRHIDKTANGGLIFEDEDQLDIAWGIINWAQQKVYGSYNFTRASAVLSGITRTKRYRPWERVNIGDELRSLGEATDGFDFEISPTKQWTTYYPQKGGTPGITFSYAEGGNVHSLAYDRDAKNVISVLTGLGAGSGRARCIAIYQSISALTRYGLLEDIEDFGNIRHYSQLAALTRAELRKRKIIRAQPQMVVATDDPPFGSYGLGDSVTVVAVDGYLNINSAHRVIAMNMQISNEGKEVCQVFLDEARNTDEAEVLP